MFDLPTLLEIVHTDRPNVREPLADDGGVRAAFHGIYPKLQEISGNFEKKSLVFQAQVWKRGTEITFS